MRIACPVGPTDGARGPLRLDSSPESARPDALPIRLKTNRILLPAASLILSSFLFFFFFSFFLSELSAKTDLSPMLIPIVAHAYRVLVCERKDWKKRGPFACLFTLSKGRDAFSATFFAGYWTRQMSQRTFSERLSLKSTITRSATTIVNQEIAKVESIDAGIYQSDLLSNLKFGIHFFWPD